jgi:hypothetical protein
MKKLNEIIKLIKDTVDTIVDQCCSFEKNLVVSLIEDQKSQNLEIYKNNVESLCNVTEMCDNAIL